MKQIFKKYINSSLTPEEFDLASDFLGKKENDLVLSGLMKNEWYKNLGETEIPARSNPELKKRIKEAVRIHNYNTAKNKVRIYKIVLRVAAVLLFALIINSLFLYNLSLKNNKTYSAEVQTITTPYGAKTSMTLPDGSEIWLNSGSTISYPVSFKDKRSVTLVGEAYFEVQKGEVPFIVSTNYGEVEVKGTSFNVKAFADDDNFETTLEEGVVTLRNNRNSKTVLLKPGQYAINDSDGFSVKDVDTKYFTSWREGKLILNREPFSILIKKLERWYNVKIEYSDKRLDEIWYTGTIEMESLLEVMDMMSKSSDISYKYNTKTRVLNITKQ